LYLLRLQPHFTKSANYCKFQSAYWKGQSTKTALLRVVSNIQRAAGNGQCTSLLALDISAFDAVMLIYRAHTVFGIHDVAFLTGFNPLLLSERTQQIAVAFEKSALL